MVDKIICVDLHVSFFFLCVTLSMDVVDDDDDENEPNKQTEKNRAIW